MTAALAEVFPVGEILADELEARGWSQVEFAEILGRPAQFVSEIISGKKEITRESATQIAAALGTSPEMWLSIQDGYYLWRQGKDGRAQEQLSDVRLRARLNELAPIGVLLKRGLITGGSPKEQEAELKQLYGIVDITDDPKLLVAARRTKANERVSGTQLAWAACVRRAAANRQVKRFDLNALKHLATHLTRKLTSPDDFANLPTLFAATGVRLVFVEAFPGSKMDGCSMLHDDGKPIIGISGRGKRFDKVLFTILHEVAHIVRGDLNNNQVVIDDQGDSPTLGLEEQADSQAAAWVLPKPLPPLTDRINQGWIELVSADQGIHPIILVGRLQKSGHVPWKTTLVRNAPSVMPQLSNW